MLNERLVLHQRLLDQLEGEEETKEEEEEQLNVEEAADFIQNERQLDLDDDDDLFDFGKKKPRSVTIAHFDTRRNFFVCHSPDVILCG